MIVKSFLRLFFFVLFIFLFQFSYSQDLDIIVSRIGEQQMFINSKIEVYFSTLNNTQDINYSSNDMPSFGKISNLSKGDGKITFEPGLNDVGEYEITLNANASFGNNTQRFRLIVKGIEPGTKLYYVDPDNGNDNNTGGYNSPFKTLNKILDSGFALEPGTIVYLMSGNYGNLVFSKSNQGMVYLCSAIGQDVWAEKMYFPFSKNWHISGFKISPEAANKMAEGTYVNIAGGSKNIIISNCEIFGTSSISNWTSKVDWYNFAGDGIICGGNNCTFINNNIYNTYFPVQIQGKYDEVSYNIINNFGADAVRGLGDYGKFTYNQIKNATVDDYLTGNHDDAFQSWTFGNPVKGILIKGNQITDISYPNLPLQTSIMQGIVDFDGFAEEWVIEDNLVVMHHPHGIALYGAKNCKIVNNTVVKNPFRKYFPTEDPWIRINRTKNGQLSFGNLTRNNIMGSSTQDDHPGTFDHNLVNNHYNDIFVDFNNWDFHLKGNSAAVNGGIWEDASTVDVERHIRNKGNPDLGCIENYAFDQDLYPPDKLDVLSGNMGISFIELGWDPVEDNLGVRNYHIYYNDQEFVTTDNNLLITDLYPTTEYDFTVYAEDFAGNKSNPVSQSFVTLSIPPDGIPDIIAGGVNTDQEITNRNKKEWIYGSYLKIGGTDNITDLNGVLVFKIPPLPTNQKLETVELSFYLDSIVGNPKGNIDLYGLDYRRKAEIGDDVFYQGTFSSSKDYALKDDILTINNSTGYITTDSITSIKILDYLNDQLAKGAHGNNYLFFRLNSDVENENANSYFKIASADNQHNLKPLLKFIFEHTDGVNDFELNNVLDIYPNPVNSKLTILDKSALVEQFEIYNSSGNIVRKVTINNQGNLIIDISDLNKGIYFLKAKAGNKHVVKKIIKL